MMNNKNPFRTGTVTSVSGNKARVKYSDLEGMPSGWLHIVRTPGTVSVDSATLTYGGETKSHNHQISSGAWMPSVGDMVLCVVPASSDGTGYILGLI